MTETNTEHDRERELIEAACKSHGFLIEEWGEEDGRPLATLKHTFRAIDDDEENGVFEGDRGELTAGCVGGFDYGNVRVTFALKAEGFDDGVEVNPEQVEAV